MFQPSTNSTAPTATHAAPGRDGRERSADRGVRRRTASPACHLLWHERLCTTAGTACQLRVPIVGPITSDLAARLSARLDAMWTGRPTVDGVTVTSVAAVIGRAGGQASLILFVSLDRLPARRRIDDARMARELQQALNQCTAVPA